MIFSESEKEDFASLCREHGLTVTNQRMIVYQFLKNLHSHPTADQVYEGIRLVNPKVSRASVYRILDALAKYGLIQKLAQPGTASRYDGMVRRHPHLVCEKCGNVIDLNIEGDESERNKANLFLNSCLGTLSNGAELNNYSVVFTGVCADCAKNHKKGTPK